jgi:hypothetical protein
VDFECKAQKERLRLHEKQKIKIKNRSCIMCGKKKNPENEMIEIE